MEPRACWRGSSSRSPRSRSSAPPSRSTSRAPRDLFLNPELFDANQLHVYFRVNSLFFDPNILGRYLALAITALGAYIAWSGERRAWRSALSPARCCLVGLALQLLDHRASPPLLAGLGMVALLRWGWRGRARRRRRSALAGLVALLIAGGTPTSDIQDDRGDRQRAQST